MNKIWVPDYPEAEAKCRTYQYVVEALNEQRAIIAGAKDIQLPTDSSPYKDIELKGQYYKQYTEAVTSWYHNMCGFHRALVFYLRDLDKKIEEAQRLCDIWKNRIDMGHYEGEYHYE